MLIGNDIVDLADDEARLRHIHPRFIDRVCTRREKRQVHRSSCEKKAEIQLWIFWSAKEAAYKVLKKFLPEVVFSPPRFEVTITRNSPSGDLEGHVNFQRMTLAVKISRRNNWIHSIALFSDKQLSPMTHSIPLLSCVKELEPSGDASTEVRSFALKKLSEYLGQSRLRIDDRPPRVFQADKTLSDVDISLSHHGRWIAFSALANSVVTQGHGIIDHPVQVRI